MDTNYRRRSAIHGCLLGTAVGDALGLPAEGLSRRRQARLFGPLETHRLVGGRGMFSDDAEHACLVAEALLASGGDPARFERALASGLRRWLLALPPGVGLATLKASLRLLVGVPPSRSGVASAGNGPAMRAPLLGVVLADDTERRRRLVGASTRLTHRDPRAEQGALVLAELAARSALRQPADSLRLPTGPLEGALDAALQSVARGESTAAFAAQIGCGDGVSGYMGHTVPVVLHASLSHPGDFRTAVLSVIACGGDTDTTAALVGGIVGAAVEPEGIPAPWIAGLTEWPRTPAYLDALAAGLAGARPAPRRPPGAFQLLRNAALLVLVLAHGLRRTLPPY